MLEQEFIAPAPRAHAHKEGFGRTGRLLAVFNQFTNTPQMYVKVNETEQRHNLQIFCLNLQKMRVEGEIFPNANLLRIAT